MEVPVQYILQIFFQYAGGPKHKKYTNTYYASCPVCREGKSWLKKKRLYYIPDDNLFYCQNCQRGWNPINWIKEVTGKSYHDILVEAGEFTDSIDSIISRSAPVEQKNTNLSSLPYDSINLFDTLQVKFHRNDKPVIDCLHYIQQRKLDVAINRPRTFYVSLKDKVHKNRLCIPFMNRDGKIVFYQTRAIYEKDEFPAKYLSKINADKTIFGVNNIDVNLDYLFIFEGPIDAMFVRNGLAVGGIRISEAQEKELEDYRMFNKIWVLDNPFVDEASNEKISELIERGERVFIPPPEIDKYKDINELCVAENINKIGTKFIVDNSFSYLQASLRLKRTH